MGHKQAIEPLSFYLVMADDCLLIVRKENDNQPKNEIAHREVRRTPSFSGPLMLPTRASANSLSAPIKSSGGNEDIQFALKIISNVTS